ncbi:MAG: glycosyl hydrolase, partial [Candidatus Aminicenantes bacterium]|nr:glycosyl hydrolase [Candidatus Aminicenantes bacterium]
MSYRIFFRNCVTLVILTLSSLSFSQIDESLLFRPLQWRCIGPKRGGRSIAVAGHKDRPFEYYFGATGGGLWKTTDGGTTWHPVTDGQIRSSSVGAVAVAESNPDIVYIGMGESQLRQNVL